jgi:hypothetical protein
MAAEQSAPVATGSGAGSMVNGALSHPMTIGQWLEVCTCATVALVLGLEVCKP